jgi:hypothetical protein
LSTFQRDQKRLERQLRYIPVDAIATVVLAQEREGMWCVVGGGLSFVPGDGSIWDIGPWEGDPLVYAQFERYVRSRSERVHSSWESALAFVRSRLGGGPEAEL